MHFKSGWESLIRLVRKLAALSESRVVWPIIFVVFFAFVAIRLGTDATPDFRIYHYYNGFAALHDRTQFDLVPAQLQTFLFPWLDAGYYVLFRALNAHQNILNIILSTPYAVAAWIVFYIGNLVVPGDWAGRRLMAGIAALYGTTGAGGLPTLATTMSEIPAGLFALAALAIWLSFEQRNKNTGLTTALAGAVCGLSVALKLTTAPVFVALGLIIFLRRLGIIFRGLIEAASYGVAGIVVVLLVDGQWLLHNYVAYQNPLLPNFNNIFKSDLVDHAPWLFTAYMPKTILMSIFYPAYWAFTPSHYAIELNMQDPRILLALISAIAVLAAALFRRNSVSGDQIRYCYLAIYFIVGYGLWEYQFSIYRYLTTLECLTGVMVLGAMRAWWGHSAKRWARLVFCVIVGTSAATTRYPWWSRAIPAALAVEIKLPRIGNNTMAVFLDPYAYSYLVPSLPRTSRVIGANNNMLRPGVWGKLQEKVAATITNYQGPIWGFEDPRDYPGMADQTLSYYRLARSDECVFIKTNIEDRPDRVRLCRLKRME